MEGLNDDGRLRQLSLRRYDEIHVPKAHVCARDLADVVTSHPRPGVDVKTRKKPLLGKPTVGVSSKHQRVNLYCYASGLDGMLRRHKGYTGSGQMSLHPVLGCSCYQH